MATRASSKRDGRNHRPEKVTSIANSDKENMNQQNGSGKISTNLDTQKSLGKKTKSMPRCLRQLQPYNKSSSENVPAKSSRNAIRTRKNRSTTEGSKSARGRENSGTDLMTSGSTRRRSTRKSTSKNKFPIETRKTNKQITRKRKQRLRGRSKRQEKMNSNIDSENNEISDDDKSIELDVDIFGPAKPATTNSYEEERLKRIRENQQELANLGIQANYFLKPTDDRIREAKRAAAKRRKPFDSQRPKAKRTRISRRIQGKPAEHNILGVRMIKSSANESDSDGSQSLEEDDIQDDDEALLEKWKAHILKTRESQVDEDIQRRLFLIPTGVHGVNDHTLYEKVKEVDSYLWGFCQGLYSRIFLHVRPGDIFLFVSSGTGIFNKIARVNDIKVVPKSVADRFWSRMSFCMGGTSKSNVGFPLLTPVDKPKDIEWDKREVLKLLGYNDHLQTSRWIKADILATTGGQCVLHRCIKELGIEPYLSPEEILKGREISYTDIQLVD